MLRPGSLVVFEGPDGVGKTTLALALLDRLRAEGLQATYVSFPGGEPGTLGRHVYEIHHNAHGAGLEQISPTSLQLLHVAAHIDTIDTRIRPALLAGETVLLDRFWWSTWIYGLLGGADPTSLEMMIALEKHHWKHIQPNIILLLERPRLMDLFASRLSSEYQKLAARSEHPVLSLVNIGTVPQALNAVLDRLATVARGTPPVCESRTVTPRVPATLSRLAPAKPTVVYDTYWRFAAERQEIFFRRVADAPPPWTADPILRRNKFTNAYRASDRVSQYLIRHVIYEGDMTPREVFFRIILFKIFNKIETWQLLSNSFGSVRFSEYSFSRYDAVLAGALKQGRRIYSPAYIMPSGGQGSPGMKHRMHLSLLERMVRDDLPSRLAEMKTMHAAYELLRGYPTIGPFLAYQYVIDLNYSTLLDFSEMEFVVPGPGARDGIRKCFSDLGGLTETDMIKVVADAQDAEFERRGLNFRDLWGRKLQLIDCQSLFCEVDKYARLRHPEFSGLSGRTRMKQRFKSFGPVPAPWYPPKWKLNAITATRPDNVHSL